VIDHTYLPFSAEELLPHLAPAGDSNRGSKARRALEYYVHSAERYQAFCEAHPDREGMHLSAQRKPCQIEKDERFWIATCLLRYYYAEDPTHSWTKLLERCFGNVPPLLAFASWQECLTGPLHLLLECNLPSPPSYKRWLAEHLDRQQMIPYALDAAKKPDSSGIRPGLEAATVVDALLLSEETGFAVLFEAKVLPDISCQVAYDAVRNQIARNIDVMLEENAGRPHPLSRRRPDRSLFVLVTPQMLRDRPESRLYGWLMQGYRPRPSSLARDLPHRSGVDWEGVASRLGWLTWEECNEVLLGARPWLEAGGDLHGGRHES